MEFAHLHILWLLALLPIWAGWLIWQRARTTGGLRFSDITGALQTPATIWQTLRSTPTVLLGLALGLGIIALARPQTTDRRIERSAEGIDMITLLDISTSMRAQDFSPNRFEAAREVATEFIQGRQSDRIGLIVFAAEAYTQAPLTLDYDFLLRSLDDVEIGMISDGTAIGTAIAAAVNRLKDSEAKSKVAILLTDGQNNRGEIDPTTAADIAATMGVRVYTIGVGSEGTAPYVMDHPFGGQRTVQIPVKLDEEMLQTVAQKTNARYFRATDREKLAAIYEEIDQLETSEIETEIYVDRQEYYQLFLWPAWAFVLLGIILKTTRLRQFP